MRFGPLFVLVAISVLPAGLLRAQTSQSSEPIGRVTAAFGVARVESPDGAHKGDLNTLITNGDRVRTNGGGVTVLLASRVVLKIDHDTTISLSESADQLNVILEKGTVHVFVGQRPLAAGNVCVQDPQVRAETTNGVFLASYDPQTQNGYYACEHSTLTVQSSDGAQEATLAPDRQIVVEAGRFAAEEDLDRLVFNQRKVSLERLGQAARAQGAETFRLRSRMFDTQLAINQLSEAGWIDAAQLQAQAQQKAAKKGQKKNSNNSSDNNDKKEKESSESPKTLNEEPAQQDEPAQQTDQPAPREPVLTDNTSTERPANVEPEAPAAAAVSNTQTEAPVSVESPPVAIDIEPENEPGVNHLDRPEPDIKASKGNGPKHDFKADHPGRGGNDHNDNKGPGKHRDSIAPAPVNETPAPVDETPAPPVNEIDLPVEHPTPAPAPKIDLDLPKDDTAAPAAPTKFDLGLDNGAKPQPKVSFSDGAAPAAPRVDLGSSNKGPGGGIAKANLGNATGGATKGMSFTSSGPGGAPKMDTAPPAPKLDLGGATPAPKIDLGSAAPTPKIDLGNSTPAPKVDLGSATPAPKIDFGSTTAAPNIDVTKGSTAAPAPKIDLNLDKAVAAPVDVKTSTQLDLAPQVDVAKPAGELPTKIDLGGDIAAPRIDLTPGDTIAPPKLDDVAPKTVTDAVAPPTADIQPGDLKLDAPTANVAVPTDLAKDVIVGPMTGPLPATDLPTPKDLGLDATKNATDATADAVKDAAKDVTKKVTKERRRRDRTPKTTVAPAPPPAVAPAPPPPDTTATPAPTAGGSGG